MKKYIVIGIVLMFITGCKNDFSEFVFNYSDLTVKTEYSYSYNSDKLSESKEITYLYSFGNITDSIISVSNFEYEANGLLSKTHKTKKSKYEDKKSIVYYFYNENDSLIKELEINSSADTILWKDYGYFPDGRKITFHRKISKSMDLKKEYTEAVKEMKIDTNIYWYKYEYAGNNCTSWIRTTINNKVLLECKNQFKNDKVKESSFVDYTKPVEKRDAIKYFDYSKSKLKPDYFMVDANNDTISSKIHEFVENELKLIISKYDYGKVTDKKYYLNNQKVGLHIIDRNMNLEIKESYKYNEDRELKTMFRKIGPINSY